MSYRWPARTANYREWTHDTIPMTSIMVLERALNICGFHVRVDGKDLEKPMLFDELRYARERITMASEVEERIAAYEAYIDLIARFDMLNTQLPNSISLRYRESRIDVGIRLQKNLLGYTAYGTNRHTNSITTTLNLVPSDVKKAIRALNKAYKSVARDLVSESRAVPPVIKRWRCLPSIVLSRSAWLKGGTCTWLTNLLASSPVDLSSDTCQSAV